MDFLSDSHWRLLQERPRETARIAVDGSSVEARLLIPHITKEVRENYTARPTLEPELANLPFRHFGLSVVYEREIILDVFDEDYQLHESFRNAVARFGVCLFRNVKLVNSEPEAYQKNIFPNLKFHVDRGHSFDNQYSLFYRNPEDPDHAQPRNTSSLIVPNAVFNLQADLEDKRREARSKDCVLFSPQLIPNLTNKIVVEQRWDAPRSTGEVCLFDNRTVLHASYHRESGGYKISVQYLY